MNADQDIKFRSCPVFWAAVGGLDVGEKFYRKFIFSSHKLYLEVVYFRDDTTNSYARQY